MDRSELIAICERSFVPQDKWINRDSAMAQRQVGECLALLRAGCDFVIRTEETVKDGHGCLTDNETIWVDVYFHGFNWFENGYDDGEDYRDDDTFYLPTPARLDKRAGEDWY